MKSPVQISAAELTIQVNQGMKKTDLAKHYGIPVSQMGLALKAAGLRIRSFQGPGFVLIQNETLLKINVIADTNLFVENTIEAIPSVDEVVEPIHTTWNN